MSQGRASQPLFGERARGHLRAAARAASLAATYCNRLKCRPEIEEKAAL
jgi:hypothetical protein